VIATPEQLGATYFAYNDADLVSHAHLPGGAHTYFYYDGLLRRYAMEHSGQTTYFGWDSNGLNLLTERDAAGNLTAEYTHGHSPIPGIGTAQTVRKLDNATPHYQYPIKDHRGTVHKLIDANQTIVATYEYDAFGRPIVTTEDATTQALGNRLRYQTNWLVLPGSNGRFSISRWRMYDAYLGAFTGRDPDTYAHVGPHEFSQRTGRRRPMDRQQTPSTTPRGTFSKRVSLVIGAKPPYMDYDSAVKGTLNDTAGVVIAPPVRTLYGYVHAHPTIQLDPDGRAVGLGTIVVVLIVLEPIAEFAGKGIYAGEEKLAHERMCECLRQALKERKIVPFQDMPWDDYSERMRILLCRWLMECSHLAGVAGRREAKLARELVEAPGTSAKPITTSKEGLVSDGMLTIAEEAADALAEDDEEEASGDSRSSHENANSGTRRGQRLPASGQLAYCLQRYKLSD